MEQRFFMCSHCGNIVAFVKNSGVPVKCCGEDMKEIVAGVAEASREKHIPVIERNGNIVKVSVGEVAHPMMDEHYIEWISIQTKFGNQRKCLNPNGKPEAQFALLEGDEVECAYAYCNLHSLWKR